MTEALRELMTGNTLWLMLLGVVAGIVIGALPGLTATMGVALLVPFTFWLPTLPALMVLLGVYVGAMYGGAIPAVLIRTPGTPAAAATSLDGYPMAQAGNAGLAIGISCITGVVGGVFSTLVLMVAAPQVARFALKFGPAEYFALAVFGLSVIASLSERSLLKGALMGVCGLLLATIGMDPITAVPRFTFGMTPLLEGLALIPVRAVEGLLEAEIEIRLAGAAHAGSNFQHVGCEVARFAEILSDEARRRRQAITVLTVAAVVVRAGRRLIKPDIEPRTARRAHRSRSVKLAEPHAFVRQTVHVRRLHRAVAITA